MPHRVKFVWLLVMATAASAQRATGFRVGSKTGFRPTAAEIRPPNIVGVPGGRDSRFFERGFNQRFSKFSGIPYYPYLGAYPLIGNYGLDYYAPGTEDRVANNTII